MRKKEPFKLEKEFYFPSTPEELYNKAASQIKIKKKVSRNYPDMWRKFYIEEENPPLFIKFRIIDTNYFGDYKRSTLITIMPQSIGSKVSISTPKAANDNLSLSNIEVSDDMLMLYKFLGGEVTNSVLRAIYLLREVYINLFLGLFWLLILFGLAIVLPYNIFKDNLFLGVIIDIPILMLAYILQFPMVEIIRNRINIIQAFRKRK